MFVELDTRESDGLTVSLEWDRDTGRIQLLVGDVRVPSKITFVGPQARARDPFRHALRVRAVRVGRSVRQ